ncbi:MAG: hypothetical protein HC802_04255 [Caldilineaceae bacterium]|nr:hypothetical protein [Caldilineaceae bacterium]
MFASVLTIVFLLYLISVAIFLIMENRRPQSTYAWLLAFVTVPVIGVIAYIFTGRGWKLFSQERKLAESAIGKEAASEIKNTRDEPGRYGRAAAGRGAGSNHSKPDEAGCQQCRPHADRSQRRGNSTGCRRVLSSPVGGSAERQASHPHAILHLD